jgi:hypothetical protein
LVREQNLTVTGAARLLGRSPSLFSGPNSMLARYLSGGVAGLVPPARVSVAGSDLTEWIEGLGWFVPAASFFYMCTNLTCDRGSVPEAVRRTISLPALPVGWKRGQRERFLRAIKSKSKNESKGEIAEEVSDEVSDKVLDVPTCPVELREAILAREKAGQAMVPSRIARQITVASATIRQRRNPTEASLDYLNAPGSLFFFNDPLTGERRPPLAGEVIEADDATINFPVCVPWSLGGDPCSDKWGVKVGRFQWLVAIDAARRFVTAWTYVMRPRSSYRGEDALGLMRAHCLQHGVPLQWRFEQGAWKSKLVVNAIKAMGSHLQTVWSPHQKPYIEGLFNSLWTKLAVQFPGADVGRFQGEGEEACRLLTACKSGAQDPRRHFPMLSEAVGAFDEVIRERNSTPVRSAIGSWVPSEAWERRTGNGDEPRNGDEAVPSPIRRLEAESEWIFAPYVREWTVRGMLVGGRVPLFEDLSVPFDFSAPWMTDFDGARVRCHFDPAAPRCHATVVLMEARNGKSAGTILGSAQQINEVAGYARLVLGWGDDPTNAGRLARQRAASALRREVRAVVGGPGKGHSVSEERDGVSMVTRIEVGGTAKDQTPNGDAVERVPTTEEFSAERLERAARFERENALEL